MQLSNINDCQFRQNQNEERRERERKAKKQEVFVIFGHSVSVREEINKLALFLVTFLMVVSRSQGSKNHRNYAEILLCCHSRVAPLHQVGG